MFDEPRLFDNYAVGDIAAVITDFMVAHKDDEGMVPVCQYYPNKGMIKVNIMVSSGAPLRYIGPLEQDEAASLIELVHNLEKTRKSA